jgi:hypothetical protein
MMTITGRVGLLLVGALLTRILGAGGDGVHVCVGADRVLRLERSARCAAGSTEYYLAEVEPELADAPGDEKAGTADLAALQQRVATLSERLAVANQQAAALSQRMAALEAAPKPPAPAGKGGQAASRVVAPFEVVDQAGKAIFAVRPEPRGLVLLDSQGRQVVLASALAEGGFFKARSGDGSLETVMGVNNKYAGFVLRGTGGKSRGSFAITEDGKPILNMTNDNFVTVVALTQGSTGGGYLALGNAEGASTVEAGTTPEGVGLVRAMPNGNPGAGLVGMPGTFILGRK